MFPVTWGDKTCAAGSTVVAVNAAHGMHCLFEYSGIVTVVLWSLTFRLGWFIFGRRCYVFEPTRAFHRVLDSCTAHTETQTTRGRVIYYTTTCLFPPMYYLACFLFMTGYFAEITAFRKWPPLKICCSPQAVCISISSADIWREAVSDKSSFRDLLSKPNKQKRSICNFWIVSS